VIYQFKQHQPQISYDSEIPIDTNSLGDLKSSAGCWIIPDRWNNGGFDCAFYKDDKIRMIQITKAKTHSLKMKFVCNLISKMKDIGLVVKELEVDFVVPSFVNFAVSAFTKDSRAESVDFVKWNKNYNVFSFTV